MKFVISKFLEKIKLINRFLYIIMSITFIYLSTNSFRRAYEVLILLILCYLMVHIFWRWNQNPDIMCIPLLTAIGDFLGVCFLLLCFHLVYLTGEKRLRNTTTEMNFSSIRASKNKKNKILFSKSKIHFVLFLGLPKNLEHAIHVCVRSREKD
ncbi:Solute carrier family 41 member 2 [Brachionus plicatilis]|uniref:Solute carrier family 41 member 2 n=1 Tax=Brachionus plicatilis TaxID=10195 RepID=A0A3M7PG90_BRAPC|nr:Solute carrier family 41 member 2 [Brachionus plicatilis]